MLLVVLLHRSVLLERWLVVVVERDMLLHDADVDILANMDNSVVEVVVDLGLDLDPRQLDLVAAAAVDAMLCV